MPLPAYEVRSKVETTSVIGGAAHTAPIDVQNRDVRILLTVSNLSHVKNEVIVQVADHLQTALKIDMTSDSKTLTEVVGQLDKILFDDYIKSKSTLLGRTIEKGVLGGGVDWYNAPKPMGERGSQRIVIAYGRRS